jgi:hypothetical protein
LFAGVKSVTCHWLWREHVLTRKEVPMNKESNSSGLYDKRLSWRETVIGLFPFALSTIFLLSSYPVPSPEWKNSTWWQTLTVITYLVPVLVILGIGWASKFPRWSYPYVGFLSLGLSAVLLEPMHKSLINTFRDVWAQALVFSVTLILIFGCLVLVGYVWRPLRSLYKGIRHDWTRFSFGLYLVAALFASVVDQEDFPVLTVAVIAPSLILFFGALACLRSTTKTQRVLSMLIALVLAMTVRIIEYKLTYAEIIAIMGIVTCLPALLELLPRSEKSAHVV